MNDEATDQLPDASTDERLARMEATLAVILQRLDKLDVVSIRLDAISGRLDDIERTQSEMYVDLRQRLKLVHDKIDVVQREVEEYLRDSRPDSLQSRLMN